MVGRIAVVIRGRFKGTRGVVVAIERDMVKLSLTPIAFSRAIRAAGRAYARGEGDTLETFRSWSKVSNSGEYRIASEGIVVKICDVEFV